jgi:hypothetical protein
MHDAIDGDRDGMRWLSYAELADARRISKRSAIRLTFRHRWQRQKGNDGTVRVAVPMSELERRSDTSALMNNDDVYADAHADAGTIRALEAVVSELRERAERDKAEIARERGRADALEAQLSDLRGKFDAVGENAAQLREDRATAVAKAEAAERQADGLRAQVRELGELRAKAYAQAESLLIEIARLQTEAEQLKAELGTMAAAGWRSWLRPWRSRGRGDSASGKRGTR